MKVEIIKCLKDNYSYIIVDEEKQSACVIDPSEAEPIINFVENKKIHLKYILNTHHHYDHVGGNLKLKERYNAKIIGFKDDKDRIPGIDDFVNYCKKKNIKINSSNLSFQNLFSKLGIFVIGK